MPETRDYGDLDTRIRELVARAVADAPSPPDLDRAALHAVEVPDHGHRRWWVGGGAALLAAAAAIAAFLLVGDTDEQVQTPSVTQPSVAPTPAPTPPGTGPPTFVAETPILTAGGGGVFEHVGAQTRRLTETPMAIALDTGDGRVIVQRQRGEGSWNAADTEPLLITGDGTLRPLFDGFDWGGYVMLHDVEVVDGRRLLLYSVFEGDPPRPQRLSVADLASGESEDMGGTDVDPADRLHLATTGLIVGAWQNQLSHGIEIHAVPGSPAAANPPTPASLGLEDEYNCDDCPGTFSVTPDGGRVAWIDGESDNLVAVSPEGGTPQPVTVVPGGPFADLDWDGQRLVISFSPADGSVPVVLPTDEPLEGRIGTMSPAASAAPENPPSSTPATAPGTTAPAETVAPPVAVDVVLTAGPDGVVRRVGGERAVLTTEAMVFALDAGDGRVIVQRRSGDGTGQGWTDADTAPMVLEADGSLSPLFATVDWDGGVVLHDIEVVDGRRLLLFSLQVAMNVNPDAADETLYVVDLDTQDRTEIGNIGGWEYGTHRLHLATSGLIVGESYSGASHAIEILAVPGSPAAAAGVPTPADLGLRRSYGDCNDCPHTFSVSPDGATVAWIDGATNRLMRVPVDGGTAERVAQVPAERFADLDYDDSRAVLTFFEFVSAGETPAPFEVPFDGSGPNELEGITATLGRYG